MSFIYAEESSTAVRTSPKTVEVISRNHVKNEVANKCLYISRARFKMILSNQEELTSEVNKIKNILEKANYNYISSKHPPIKYPYLNPIFDES